MEPFLAWDRDFQIIFYDYWTKNWYKFRVELQQLPINEKIPA